MNEKKVEGDATLEKVAGGSSQEVTTFLYRCPKCGRESRVGADVKARPGCIVCFVPMEKVEGSMQLDTL